eukprot:TRINITY_DN62505_c0_g1_i1.p1 TRINITY_DN62505_c0_g1~~TRINITY_DN62505_c0_g1_i1.p1  ORF type:complete len:475 (+),score=81.81 TRINITY_DN62505_c0_g1_i1:47-1426(+)
MEMRASNLPLLPEGASLSSSSKSVTPRQDAGGSSPLLAGKGNDSVQGGEVEMLSLEEVPAKRPTGLTSVSGGSSSSAAGQHRPLRGDDVDEDAEEALTHGLVSQGEMQKKLGRQAVMYLVYCSICFALTCALLVVSVLESWMSGDQSAFWARRLQPWEEAGEAFVGGALCTETVLSIRHWRRNRKSYRGKRRIFWDCWRVFDAIIAGLTLILGMLFLVRRMVTDTTIVFKELDVPILGIRFALQPVRMARTTSMVVQAARVAAAREVHIRTQAHTIVDPRMPCPALQRPALTPSVASQIRDMLPPYLQYADWRLVYSPQVHGTSFQTFFRRQAGPNVLVVRDAHGGLFGGFATEPWRPEVGAYGGTCEAFVWEAKVENDEPVKAFWAIPARGRVVQWSTPTLLGLGRAIVLSDEFLRGSSAKDETFGTERSLSPAGVDFVIQDFECWHVGGAAGDSDQE